MTDSFASGHPQHDWLATPRLHPSRVISSRRSRYRIVIFPLSALLAATGAMRRILQEIAQAGTPTAAMHELPTFAEFVDFIGLPQVHAAEQRYAVKAAAPGPGTGGADGSDV
jgi:hypothetical protein